MAGEGRCAGRICPAPARRALLVTQSRQVTCGDAPHPSQGRSHKRSLPRQQAGPRVCLLPESGDHRRSILVLAVVPTQDPARHRGFINVS